MKYSKPEELKLLLESFTQKIHQEPAENDKQLANLIIENYAILFETRGDSPFYLKLQSVLQMLTKPFQDPTRVLENILKLGEESKGTAEAEKIVRAANTIRAILIGDKALIGGKDGKESDVKLPSTSENMKAVVAAYSENILDRYKENKLDYLAELLYSARKEDFAARDRGEFLKTEDQKSYKILQNIVKGSD